MAFRPIFRRDQTFQAIRDFTSGGSLVKMGQEISRKEYPLHVIQLWFRQRKIGQAGCDWTKDQIEESKVKYAEKAEPIEKATMQETQAETVEVAKIDSDEIEIGTIEKHNPQGPYYDVWNGDEWEAIKGRRNAEARADELKGDE